MQRGSSRLRTERRQRVDIASACRGLAREHGNPRLGNRRNPLDELLFVILSTRTQDATYRRTFRALKSAYPRWALLRRSERARVAQILQPGGLAQLKARQIVAILESITRSFGAPTLAPLRHLDDEAAERFLTGLPGVGRKVAKCVLMYSLDRQVLPVDVHVHRLASRLGLRVKRRPDTSQDLIEDAIPPKLRYGFHVNAVAHGRSVCLPTSPRCDECRISSFCRYYRHHGKPNAASA
ncbi:MAG: endonuclease III [Gemmatimonadota bacterium]|nr:endonuclease III [Gemmatimonadota bacterium]